ncbi:MAG: hypothetical protein R2747_06035 [Pyrinomonadaceae bacterium]
MDNKFDFDSDNLEFDDFDASPEELESEMESYFGEMEEFDLQEVNIRTAILQKNNMLALLCVKTANQGGAICRVDPREPNPAVQLYDDPEKAIEWFSKSLRTSQKNGWSVVYDGLPLRG